MATIVKRKHASGVVYKAVVRRVGFKEKSKEKNKKNQPEAEPQVYLGSENFTLSLP